jgi:NAD(P)-dependent dehydrogenase (short-subunit alcohol dehydrogenase family)
MPFDALSPRNVAVVTGAAAGIGRAAARRFAAMGLRLCLADRESDQLAAAAAEIAALAPGGADDVLALPTDVAEPDSLQRLAAAVHSRFGGVDVLMNNAGIQPDSSTLRPDNWARIMAVNLWGVINGTQAFAPAMVAGGRPGLIINTGSKQGITTPPGNPAYNVSKAGVKAFTEALQHELRQTEGCAVSAHLLIPGFVFTGLTANGRTEKPPGAWTPDETVAFMMTSLERGDFYILCPDNDVTRDLDERRILWGAGDIVKNRPPLSRWHPDYAAAAKAFIEPAG